MMPSGKFSMQTSNLPANDYILTTGHLNGRVGEKEARSEGGERIVDVLDPHDLVLMNMWFIK